MNIEINHLKKAYQDKIVLDIEHLSLPNESIVAIVGPNGAGKSTLLHSIANLLEPNDGEVLYDGENQPPLDKMTCVFQKPYLLSTTVKNNIIMPLKIRKIKKDKIEQRLIQLEKDFHLHDLLEKKASELSLGEVQKVALARALSFYPQLLLLDEPCASIDSYSTQVIEENLIKMKNEFHTTILLVTHNLAQAKRIADVVVLLNKGKLIECNKKDDFFHHPHSSQTKAFIEGELII